MQAVTITQISPPELEALIENTIKKALSQTVNQKEEAPILLTRKEAASFLKICLPNLDDMVREGTIPASRIGTRVRFLKSDLVNSLPRIKGAKS